MSPWFAVLGQPVAHSRSPEIHAAFAQQFGRTLRYERIECAAGQLAAMLAALAREGLIGANITLPLKAEAFALCSARSPGGDAAQAVNTLARIDRNVPISSPISGPGSRPISWRGDNTDGAGLVRDLQLRHGIALAKARILILGAGGAVQGILGPILASGPHYVHLHNRSAARAQALCQRFDDSRLRLATAQPTRYDLIINGSAAGHQGETWSAPFAQLGAELGGAEIGGPELRVPELSVYYDLSYGFAAQADLAKARALGYRAIDGLGMLVEQAALAFTLWFDQQPITEPVYQQLRHQIGQQSGQQSGQQIGEHLGQQRPAAPT